jgi:ComF family protein
MGILNNLADIIYPPRCIICHGFIPVHNTLGLLCLDCYSDFHRISSPFCPVCGIPFDGSGNNHLCGQCLKNPPFFDAMAAPYVYEGKIKKAIYILKYEKNTLVADIMGPVLARFVHRWMGDNKNITVVPVPLHPKRLRARGFNQSMLIARYVADFLDAGIDFLSLRRIHYTMPQAMLDKKDRHKNVHGAFCVKRHISFEEKTVLLVDDVATTTNTLNECARVLKRAGARKIMCAVIARTP